MNQYGNDVLAEDIMRILESQLDFSKLRDKTVLITGATGLIGSFLVRTLLCLNQETDAGIHIVAMVRDLSKANQAFGKQAGEIEFLQADVCSEIQCPFKIDYIIHGASITESAAFVNKPVETIDVTLMGLKNVLELARKNQVESFVYLSSMEVYGLTDSDLETVTEQDYGYLNPLDVRSSYSEGKRMAECICCAYAKEYGININIVRLVQTFGAGVKYNDNRVFAQFARAVIEERDIVLHTKGETLRSYCYISDAAEGILYVLLKGRSGHAYNIANTDATISIYDMAQMLAQKYPKTAVKIQEEDITKFGYNPVVKMKMNTDKIRLLGWMPKVGIEEAFERLIASMKIEKSEMREDAE